MSVTKDEVKEALLAGDSISGYNHWATLCSNGMVWFTCGNEGCCEMEFDNIDEYLAFLDEKDLERLDVA